MNASPKVMLTNGGFYFVRADNEHRTVCEEWAEEYVSRQGWWFRLTDGLKLRPLIRRLQYPRTQDELALSLSLCQAWCDEYNERRENAVRVAEAVKQAVGLTSHRRGVSRSDI